jgi:3-keto-5-aminohexanoate cleavage enzyme
MPERKPLIIGVNVNEGTLREPNPHVPYTPGEIADVAAASECAGAAVMHFHARHPDGSMDHTSEGYAAVVRAVRARSEILLAPSMANVAGYGVQQRLSNVAPNQADPRTRVEFLPIDMGCANMDLFDPVAAEYTSSNRVFINDTATQIELLARCSELHLTPYLASFNLSWTRAILSHAAAGRLPRPATIVFILGGEEFVAAHPTTAAGLRAQIEMLSAGLDAEWLVSSYRGDVFAVADDVIAAGGHLIVGIGDYPHSRLGCPTTPELVARVAEMGRRQGRPPATVAQAREMLGVSARADR